MNFKAGASCDFTWTDPSVPYKKTDKGPLVLRPQEGRQIWRDTGPLALLQDRLYESSDAKVRFSRPLLVEQFERLVLDRRIDEDTPLSLTVYGMRTDMKMKVFEWQKEVLAVPTPMVVGSTFALFAQDRVDEAGRVEFAVEKALKHLYPRDGGGNPKGFNTVIDNAAREYWSELRGSYEAMLDRLAGIPTEEQSEGAIPIRESWQGTIKSLAVKTFTGAAEDMDTYGDSIQRQVEAREILSWRLRSIFETPEQKDARKKKSKVSSTSVKGGDKH
jgi:hypothetical protein